MRQRSLLIASDAFLGSPSGDPRAGDRRPGGRGERSSIAILGILALGVVAASPAAGAATPVERCAASKQKAAGTVLRSRMSCYASAVVKGSPVDPNCLAKAEAKFTAVFNKADTLVGPCPGTIAQVEPLADQCVADLLALMPGVGPNKCLSSKRRASGNFGRAEQFCIAKSISAFDKLAQCRARSQRILFYFDQADRFSGGPCAGSLPGVQGITFGCAAAIAAVLPPTTTTTTTSTSTTTSSTSTPPAF